MLTRNHESTLRDSHYCQEMQDVDEEKGLLIQTAAKYFKRLSASTTEEQ